MQDFFKFGQLIINSGSESLKMKKFNSSKCELSSSISFMKFPSHLENFRRFSISLDLIQSPIAQESELI